MRAGRVLDAGTPAELVGLDARRATVAFSLPDVPAALLDQLSRLDGVRDVPSGRAPQVAVHGDRGIIAYVGAALVAHGPGASRPERATCRAWKTPCWTCSAAVSPIRVLAGHGSAMPGLVTPKPWTR